MMACTRILSHRIAVRSFATASVSNEVKDASLIFSAAFDALEARVGREALQFPKECIWLGGAPGSGKGTNTDFILRERDIDAPAVVTSSLLNSPAAKAVKAAGGMVGDKEVVEALLDTLLSAEYTNGVLVDGFPRTSVQAEVTKLLHDKMLELHAEKGLVGMQRPIFRIAVLFVDEMVSVERQMGRGITAQAHNEKVRSSGLGELQEERPTDFDQGLAQRRYAAFNEMTFPALKRLGEDYLYNFINAGGDFAAVEQNIKEEMQYQSSIELDAPTFDVVSTLPIASQVTANARQALVRRMDSYTATAKGAATFAAVANAIAADVLPTVEVSGFAFVPVPVPLTFRTNPPHHLTTWYLPPTHIFNYRESRLRPTRSRVTARSRSSTTSSPIPRSLHGRWFLTSSASAASG